MPISYAPIKAGSGGVLLEAPDTLPESGVLALAVNAAGKMSSVAFPSTTRETLGLATTDTVQFGSVRAGGSNVGYSSELLETGLGLRAAATLAWSNGDRGFDTKDIILSRDAANTLAQRNSTSGQKSRLYKTYTSATSGEWYEIDAATDASNFDIAACIGSAGGSTRGIRLGSKNAAGTFTPWLALLPDSIFSSVGYAAGFNQGFTSWANGNGGSYAYYGAIGEADGGSALIRSNKNILHLGDLSDGTLECGDVLLSGEVNLGTVKMRVHPSVSSWMDFVDSAGTSTPIVADSFVGGGVNVGQYRDSSGTVCFTTGGTSTLVNLPLYGTSNVLDIQNGVAAQRLRIAKTWTSATSHEFLDLNAADDASNYRIGSRIGSAGGSTRGLQFGSWDAAGAFASLLSVDTVNGLVLCGGNNFVIQSDGNVRSNNPITLSWIGSIKFNNTWVGSGVVEGEILRTATDEISILANNGTKFRNLANSADAPITAASATFSGTLQIGNAAVAETPTATHTLIIKDSTGTSYRVLAVAV